MIKVLVVGQTPPPVTGQAVLIDALVHARPPLARVEITHVRMAFARDVDDIGKVRAAKAVELLRVLAAVAKARARGRFDVLYYPPSGGSRPALLRDIVLLLALRPLVAKTVFHLHAGGLDALYPRLSPIERALFHRAFDRPDATVRSSPFAPDDGALYRSRRDVIVAPGVVDGTRDVLDSPSPNAVPVVLFAGILRASKGVRVLVDACALLARRGVAFELALMGAWEEPAFRAEIEARLAETGLGARTRWLGVLRGAEKHRAFASADVFCFPTLFDTFGLVAVEAMSFSLPVVASDHGALPTVVDHGVTGLLAKAGDATALADALGEVLVDADRRRAMGRAGRAVYETRFTLAGYVSRMEDVLVDVAASPSIE